MRQENLKERNDELIPMSVIDILNGNIATLNT